MKTFVFLLGVTSVLAHYQIGNFQSEWKRIKKSKPFLDTQVSRVNLARIIQHDSRIRRVISALKRSFPRLPPNAELIPTNVLADNVPFPDDKTKLGPNEMPLYFPRRGQERDLFGRHQPVFVPYFVKRFNGIAYFPFDRQTLRLLVPQFKIGVAFDGGNLEGRNLPVYLALQMDRYRIKHSEHFAVPDKQAANDTRLPLFRHYHLN